jgi:hypothetical protein
MTKSTELTSVQDAISKRIANVASTTDAPSSKRISTKGGVFTLPGGETNKGPIHSVVVDFVRQNNFYKAAYNPNESAPPECYAIGRNIDELKPSPNCSEPQFDGLCKDCPNNQFGSDRNGGKGKACTNNLNLALLPEEFDADSDIMLLRIAPTALTSWNKHVRALANKNLDPVQVITAIEFNTAVSYPTLLFKADKPIAATMLETVGPHMQLAAEMLESEPKAAS